MFKEMLIVLTKPICNCGEKLLEFSINTSYGQGLSVSCTKCKKMLYVSLSDLSVRVRVMPVLEGGAEIVSFEEAKKIKE